MQIYFFFPEGWYAIIAILMLIWLSILVYRKSYKNKKEIRQQIIISIITLAVAFIIELIGVSLGLWNYMPGNWPIILWPLYFIAGLAGYQILKLVIQKNI